jgi:hypothetical protein
VDFDPGATPIRPKEYENGSRDEERREDFQYASP